MKEFNLSKWRQFIIEEAVVADGNFGNDIEDRYAYIRPLMADLPDNARTESLIDGMEDGLREDDKGLFDYYFVEAMKMLGLEHQLMDDGEIEGPGIEDLTPDPALGPNPSFVEEGEDSLINPKAEEKEKLDEVAAELIGQYGAEAVNGLYMLAGILGLPIAAVLASVASGDIDIDLKGTLKDLYKSTGDSVKSKAKSLAKALGLGSGSPAMGEGKKTNDEVLDEIIGGSGFKVGDFVYLRNDPKKSPMEVVDIRKMFGKNLQAVSVIASDGEKIEFDQSQLKKLPSAEEKANVFVR